MKRSFVFFCALMAGALSFSSCNKDLKDDINELKRDLGVAEPITVTTTFTDFENAERKVTATCKYKDDNTYSNGMIKNPDGTYSIGIGRYEAPVGNQSVELEFEYDPTTKKILYKNVEHYWDDINFSNGRVDVSEGDEPEAGLTFNIDIKSIDLESGAINLDVKVEGTKEYANNNYWEVPNTNSAFSTVFSFNGKLGVFTRGKGEQPN